MFSVDDRTGNVITTVVLFVVAAGALYLARGAFLILFLSLLFAYLLEPAVSFSQQHSRLGRKNRGWAIAEVYLIGIFVLGGLGYELVPRIAAQVKTLSKAVPEILEGFSTGNPIAMQGGHGLSAAQQLRVEAMLAHHRDLIARSFEGMASSATYVAGSAIWLLAVPILAIFILRDGRPRADVLIKATVHRENATPGMRILERVDSMLARYTRAQSALAGLSFLFYGVCLLAFRFPYAMALAALGGVLEFLPAVGWIISAAAILTVGFLTHSHWIWMAVLLVAWRLFLNYAISPRVMGNSLELQPLTVLFALMVGAQAGGIAGAYFSGPAAAVLRIVWQECFSARNSSTTLSDPPLVKVKT